MLKNLIYMAKVSKYMPCIKPVVGKLL